MFVESISIENRTKLDADLARLMHLAAVSAAEAAVQWGVPQSGMAWRQTSRKVAANGDTGDGMTADGALKEDLRRTRVANSFNYRPMRR